MICKNFKVVYLKREKYSVESENFFHINANIVQGGTFPVCVSQNRDGNFEKTSASNKDDFLSNS